MRELKPAAYKSAAAFYPKDLNKDQSFPRTICSDGYEAGGEVWNPKFANKRAFAARRMRAEPGRLLPSQPRGACKSGLKLHIDNYVNTPRFPGGCPLVNCAVDADDGNLALRTRVKKTLKGWEDLLAKIVEDGQSAGEINPEVDPRSVANLVISILEGATIVARINKRSQALDDAQRHLNLYLERAVT